MMYFWWWPTATRQSFWRFPGYMIDRYHTETFGDIKCMILIYKINGICRYCLHSDQVWMACKYDVQCRIVFLCFYVVVPSKEICLFYSSQSFRRVSLYQFANTMPKNRNGQFGTEIQWTLFTLKISHEQMTTIIGDQADLNIFSYVSGYNNIWDTYQNIHAELQWYHTRANGS